MEIKIMPYYNFFCYHCGLTLERFFKIKDLPESEKCEKCGGYASRMFTPPSVVINNPVTEARKGRGRG
jgi:putative FmdB family regulatory protein